MNQNGFYLTTVSVYINIESHQICECLNCCSGLADVSVLLYIMSCQRAIAS